ncbi:monocarboxylate transporter 13-like [Amphiura filiformis]|uniref:monocarboxylate transporter 13-like n=1 Tax=Amphiura filiformis TaxID=82378 RepID=UPI003B21517A
MGVGFIAGFAVMNDTLETKDVVTDAFAWYFVVFGAGAIAGGFTSENKGIVFSHWMASIVSYNFVTQTWIIGLAISLIPGIGSFACLLLSGLRRSGIIDPGYTIIFAGSVAGMGLILASLCQHLAGLVIAIAMQSFMAISKVTALGVLPDYFNDDTINTANSIATCGMSIGVIALPPFTQFLLDTYGWRGALWILGAVTLHYVVCGDLIKYNQRLRLTIAMEYCKISDSDIESDETAQSNKRVSLMKRITTFISNMFNMELLKNITFDNVLVLSAASGWSYGSWLIYLIPNAEDKGIAPITASFLGTIGGLSNILGKLTFPVLKMIIKSNRVVLYNTCIICGISLAIDPLIDSFTGMAVSNMVYNFTIGLTFMANLAVMNDALGTKDAVTDAFAWIYATYGVGAIAGGFASGWLFDKTGSYNISFMLIGGVMLLPPLQRIQVQHTQFKHMPIRTNRLLSKDYTSTCLLITATNFVLCTTAQQQPKSSCDCYFAIY